jgi:cell division protein FtsA
MAGCQVNSVYTSMADANVQGLNSAGMVPVQDKEVTVLDVKRVIDAAKTFALSDEQQIMHVLPQEFIIDKQDKIREPLGMSGVRLEAKVHMIMGSKTAIENVAKCVKRCGLQVTDVILGQLAASYSVLTEEEKELGVCLINIGAGTTSVVVFQNGAIHYTMVLPIAGDQVTNDLAIALRLPTQVAEKIKVEHACAQVENADPNYDIQIAAIGNCPAQTLTQSVIAEVIEPRYEELFDIIKHSLKEKQLDRVARAGVVVTGGGAVMPGLAELAEKIFQLPVRVGAAQNAKGLSDVIDNPLYATSVGLLMYAQQQQIQNSYLKTPPKGIFSRIRHWFQGNF